MSEINPRAPLQIRLSPDGTEVAIRNRDASLAPSDELWRCTDPMVRTDREVEGWYPLVGIPPSDRAVLAKALAFRIDQATGDEDMPALTRLAEFFGGQR